MIRSAGGKKSQNITKEILCLTAVEKFNKNETKIKN